MNSLNAWVLLSISLAARDKRATLDLVVGAADAVNHSVLTPEEIQSAFRALTSKGLIAPDGNLVSLTPSGSQLLNTVLSGKLEGGPWMTQVSALIEPLAKLPAAPLPQDQESSLPTSEEAETAVRTYLGRAQQTMGVSADALHAIQAKLVAQATTPRPLVQRLVASLSRLLGRQ